MTNFGMYLGIGFQIQDDLLNLVGSEQKYGKEICGDIYEGKRTIMLNHLVKHAGENRDKIVKIIQQPRTGKNKKDVDCILNEMKVRGSIKYGRELAAKMSRKAQNLLHQMTFLKKESALQPGEKWKCEEVDFRFLNEIVNYVIERDL